MRFFVIKNLFIHHFDVRKGRMSVLSLQERGFMKVIYLEETHVIIGAQLLSARATDMISEFAVAIAQKLTLEEMASVIRPHPSFSEMITQVTTL